MGGHPTIDGPSYGALELSGRRLISQMTEDLREFIALVQRHLSNPAIRPSETSLLISSVSSKSRNPWISDATKRLIGKSRDGILKVLEMLKGKTLATPTDASAELRRACQHVGVARFANARGLAAMTCVHMR
jgi:hypothetical protein